MGKMSVNKYQGDHFFHLQHTHIHPCIVNICEKE